MPYEDNSFDLVTSYQTLEHVQDPPAVIREMLRVTRVGGGIHIRCPDYLSTFEAHYQLPWLPLFPRRLARLYLRALGRPSAGLATLNYTTARRVRRWLAQAERDSGARILIEDGDRLLFTNALRRRRLPELPGLFGAYRIGSRIAGACRREGNVNLFARVVDKRSV
jgi:SAM-dependent methyltransferase